MTIQQKIKEFETTLIQEWSSENSLNIQYKLSTLLEVYRDQFRTELEKNNFTNDEEIHKMD